MAFVLHISDQSHAHDVSWHRYSDHIKHAYVAVHISLPNGSSADSAAVAAWSISVDHLDNLWLIESVRNEHDTYTVRNIVSGTYMDLSGGNKANDTPVTGYHRTGGVNQKWIIKRETSGTGYWKIQSKVAGTFVDLAGGGGSNGTRIIGWSGGWDSGESKPNQLWTFSSQSLYSQEITTALLANPDLYKSAMSYHTDGMYLILNRARLREIWRNSKLQDQTWRSEIFDCNDFAFVYKAEAAKWGVSHFKADGFAILCGVVFGKRPRAMHACNWMIKEEDHSAIMFFEPQKNEFYDSIGYSAYFGVF